MFRDFILVGLGGGLGAATRYSFYLLASRMTAQVSIYPTLFANSIGCFLAGVFVGSLDLSHATRLFLVIGFLGGLTTFSSFALEIHRLSNNATAAFLYLLTTNALCISFCFAGWALAKSLK